MLLKGREVSRLLVIALAAFLGGYRMLQSGGSTNEESLILQLTASATDDRPTGLRLVMMGDSVTRYQYLSLAYFLRYGYWFDPNETTPNLVNEKSFASAVNASQELEWAHFYAETTKLLSPLEKCDCFREIWHNNFEVDQHVTENRYFFDPDRNNSLVYLQAFGNIRSALHGRITAEDAFRDIPSFQYQHIKSDSLWEYKDWGAALEHYVARMKATHVMMNAGLWAEDFRNNTESRDSIFRALNSTGMVGIWRTTTYENKHKLWGGLADSVMSNLFGDDNVLDVSWTRRLHRKYYWDIMHFSEPAYRVMNEELLKMVGHQFPTGYQVQNMDELLDPSITE